ncbi:MAG: hypothetical protein J7J42_02250 [Thermoplasmata archaeon]|nr:hypothetical protein [Thermoplasmata archaeon]
MKRYAWIPLGIYLASLPFFAIESLRIFLLTLMSVGITLGIIILYLIIQDELLFYIYNFAAIVSLIVSLENFNPYSLFTLLIGYSLLLLLLLHIYLYRFTQKFGVIRRDTLIYVILSIPLSYASVYLFLSMSVGYGFWGAALLLSLILVLLYFLIRSKSEKSSNAP